MTDYDQAIADAGLALLGADPALTVYDGVVVNPTPDILSNPYVLVYTTVERPSEDLDNSANGRSTVWVARWICHCVGGNAHAARAVAQRVRVAMLDANLNGLPTLVGLSCGLIRWEQSSPPEKDETTGIPVMDAIEIFRLRATV